MSADYYYGTVIVSNVVYNSIVLSVDTLSFTNNQLDADILDPITLHELALFHMFEFTATVQ